MPQILKMHGNMLSPSVLFVLERWLKRQRETNNVGSEKKVMGIMMSFSPGIGVEGCLFTV